MIYYAVAMLAALVLCRRRTGSAELLNGAEGTRLFSWKDAMTVMLPLTLVGAFRWDVGADSLYGSSYWESYQAAAQGINVRDFEVLFYLFMRVFAALKVPFFWFLFAHVILFMLCASYAIQKGSVWPQWSIAIFFLLFVYFDCYSSLRQSIAEGIVMIAWAEMGERETSRGKDIRILALLAVAGLFHSIAWLNIPVYFFCKIRMKKLDMLLLVAILVVMTPVIQTILSYVMMIVAGDQYDFLGVAVINAVMTACLFFLCWVFYDEIASSGDNAYMYVNLALCIFILILNSGAMFLPFRVFDMLKVGYVLIVPYLLRSIRDGRSRALVAILLLMVFGLWFYNQFFLQDSYVVRYQTIFPNWRTIIFLK